jgi:cardiolipin synthase
MISKCTTAIQLATVFLVLLRFEIAAVQPLLPPLFWFTTLLTTVSGLHYVVLGITLLNQEQQDKPEH